MQPEAGLTGSFQGSLFQLPEMQGGMEVDNGTQEPTQPLTLGCEGSASVHWQGLLCYGCKS